MLYFAGVAFVVLDLREDCPAGVGRSDVMAEDAAVVMRDAEAGRVCWTTRTDGRGSAALRHLFPVSRPGLFSLTCIRVRFLGVIIQILLLDKYNLCSAEVEGEPAVTWDL